MCLQGLQERTQPCGITVLRDREEEQCWSTLMECDWLVEKSFVPEDF